MKSLVEKYFSICRKTTLLSVLLCCLWTNVEGMYGGLVPKFRQEGVGAQVSSDFVKILCKYCKKARNDISELRQERGLMLFSSAGNDEPVNQSNFGGIVAMEGRKLIVAFPGTRTDQFLETLMVDVKMDVGVYPWWFGDGHFSESVGESKILVHSGFAREVEDQWNDMISCIDSCGEFDEIYFTGHSKGGGKALLSALKFAKVKGISRNSHKVKVFTFSAPAVFLGDPGVNLFYRYISGLDTVCLYKNADIVPYSTLPLGFRHVGIQGNIGLLKEKASFWSDLGQVLPAAYHITNKNWVKGLVSLRCVLGINVRSHYLEGFSEDQIEAEMQVINYNYENHPGMSVNFMGKKKY